MATTPSLGLPLVEGGQAQKHVTVNEAFTRLDALAQLSVISRTISAPPVGPAEGDQYIVDHRRSAIGLAPKAGSRRR